MHSLWAFEFVTISCMICCHFRTLCICLANCRYESGTLVFM